MKVTSWWKYNPLLHKPKALEPLVPWGSFFYYGPDPSAGVSYGCYEEESTGFTVVCAIGEQVYSPVTGKPMKLITELNPDEAKKAFSKVSSNQTNSAQCTSCNSKIYSSLTISEAPKLYCYACGSEVHRNKMEEKTMGKKEEIKATRKTLEAQLNKVQALNPASDEDTSEFIGLDEIIKRLDSESSEPAMEAPAEEPAMEEPAMEAPAEEPAMEAPAEEPAMEAPAEEPAMEAPAEEPAMEAEMESEEDEDESEGCMEASNDELDLEAIVSKVKEKVEAHRQRRATAERRKEIRKSVLAKIKERQARAKLMKKTTKPEVAAEAKTEEVKTETTVAQAIEDKKAKLKEILAAKRKERAEAQKVEVKAEETPVVTEEVVAEETPVVTEEVKTEEAPVEASTPKEMEFEGKVAKLEDKNDGSPELKEVKDAEMAKINEKKEMISASTEMRYEALADISALGSVKAEDLDMVLFGAGTTNPTWGVFAKNVPVARIQLKNQANAEEIREVFASEDYALNLVQHCAEAGLVKTLEKVGAEFWANHISDKTVADKYRSIAEAKIKEEKEAIVASFKKDFINSVSTVVVGFNKNFFKNDGHALKDAFAHNLATAGVPERTAVSIIERSFAEASATFFDQLFAKTVEFMSKSEEAKAEIAQAILDCNVINPDSNTIEAGARVEDRLERATAFASLSSNMQVVDTRVQVDADDYKARLRKAWRK